MGYNDKKSRIMESVVTDIFQNIEVTCPDLYNKWIQNVKNGVIPPDNRMTKAPEEYREDEKYKMIAKEEIRNKIRNEMKNVKSVMDGTIDDFSDQEIGELLKVLFYFDLENNVSLYRNEGEEKKTNLKSINAQIKRGRFEYCYEQVYMSLIEIANKYRTRQIVPTDSLEEDWAACADFYHNYLMMLG